MSPFSGLQENHSDSAPPPPAVAEGALVPLDPRVARRMDAADRRRREADAGPIPTAQLLGHMSADASEVHSMLTGTLREMHAAGGFSVEHLPEWLTVVRTWERVGRQTLEVERLAQRLMTENVAE
jgi:hypothetical protein